MTSIWTIKENTPDWHEVETKHEDYRITLQAHRVTEKNDNYYVVDIHIDEKGEPVAVSGQGRFGYRGKAVKHIERLQQKQAKGILKEMYLIS